MYYHYGKLKLPLFRGCRDSYRIICWGGERNRVGVGRGDNYIFGLLLHDKIENYISFANL